MKPNSTWYANLQRIRILMMFVISGHEIHFKKYRNRNVLPQNANYSKYIFKSIEIETIIINKEFLGN